MLRLFGQFGIMGEKRILGEVRLTADGRENQGDDRRDHILDEAGDDASKGTANDDTYGEIDHVAFGDEFLEVFDDGHGVGWVRRVRAAVTKRNRVVSTKGWFPPLTGAWMLTGSAVG